MDIRDTGEREDLCGKGREGQTASLSSRRLGKSSRAVGSRGRIGPPLYSWEKISYAVGRHNYHNAGPQNGE